MHKFSTVLLLVSVVCLYLMHFDEHSAETNFRNEMATEYATYTAVIDRIDEAFRQLRDLGYTEEDLSGPQFFAVNMLRDDMRLFMEVVSEKIVEDEMRDFTHLGSIRSNLEALGRLTNRLDDGMARKD